VSTSISAPQLARCLAGGHLRAFSRGGDSLYCLPTPSRFEPSDWGAVG